MPVFNVYEVQKPRPFSDDVGDKLIPASSAGFPHLSKELGFNNHSFPTFEKALDYAYHWLGPAYRIIGPEKLKLKMNRKFVINDIEAIMIRVERATSGEDQQETPGLEVRCLNGAIAGHASNIPLCKEQDTRYMMMDKITNLTNKIEAIMATFDMNDWNKRKL